MIFILYLNIRENIYVIGNVYICNGDVGYFSGLSYFLLKFIYLIINVSFIYDEMLILEDMKIFLGLLLKF